MCECACMHACTHVCVCVCVRVHAHVCFQTAVKIMLRGMNRIILFLLDYCHMLILYNFTFMYFFVVVHTATGRSCGEILHLPEQLCTGLHCFDDLC